MPRKIILKDGDVSDRWRVAFVEVRGVDGWLPRTDRWPVGATLRPGVDPADLRREVCEALRWPSATLLDGSQVEEITWSPEEVRLFTTEA